MTLLTRTVRHLTSKRAFLNLCNSNVKVTFICLFSEKSTTHVDLNFKMRGFFLHPIFTRELLALNVWLCSKYVPRTGSKKTNYHQQVCTKNRFKKTKYHQQERTKNRFKNTNYHQQVRTKNRFKKDKLPSASTYQEQVFKKANYHQQVCTKNRFKKDKLPLVSMYQKQV